MSKLYDCSAPGAPVRHVFHQGKLIDFKAAVLRMDRRLFLQAYKRARRAEREQERRLEEALRWAAKEGFRLLVGEQGDRYMRELGYDAPPVPPKAHVALFEDYLHLHRKKYRKAFDPGLPQVEPTAEEKAHWDYWTATSASESAAKGPQHVGMDGETQSSSSTSSP